jgi:hypothetical protein
MKTTMTMQRIVTGVLLALAISLPAYAQLGGFSPFSGGGGSGVTLDGNSSHYYNGGGTWTTPPGGGSATMAKVNGSTTGNLTAAQVTNTTISNYGQADANATLTAPTAAEGYNTIPTMGTTRAGKAWCFKAGTNDPIRLDGTATADGGKVCTTPTKGNYMTCFTYETDAWEWICRTGIGTWWRE